MLSAQLDSTLIEPFRAHITDPGAREAFDYLVAEADRLPGYRCGPCWKGAIRDFRYYEGDEQPFSFIVNRKSLLFYIRPPGARRLPAGRSGVQALGLAVADNPSGELQIRLADRDGARRLMSHLFPQLSREQTTAVGTSPEAAGESLSRQDLSVGSASTGLDDLWASCTTDIERAYRDLGHTLGWRFLTGPRATLDPSTDIAFISLNPAGGPADAHQTGPSCEEGSAYVVERWGNQPAGTATLQRQVQALFVELMRHRGEEGTVGEFLSTRVLTAHFIPFRSRSLAELHEKARSLDFARNLWTRVLAAWQPRLILTIDREASDAISGILTGPLGASIIEARSFPTGWGRYQADATRYRLRGNGHAVTLARLPHLSRFTLFSEPGYSATRKAALEPFFHSITT